MTGAPKLKHRAECAVRSRLSHISGQEDGRIKISKGKTGNARIT